MPANAEHIGMKMDVDLPMPEGLPETEGGQEFPYRILLVSNLAGSEQGWISGPLRERVVEVSADTFDQVMAEARPSVTLKTTDPLASGNAMVEVELAFDSLQAFTPRRLIQQIPAARAMLAVRERLTARMMGKVSSDQLARSVADAAATDPSLSWVMEGIRWTPAKPAAPAPAVDQLLGQLDLGGAEQTPGAPPPRTPIGAAVAAAAGAGASLPAEEVSALRRTLGEIDRRIAVWLNAVLHAPSVQALEAAWRSLAFVISHCEFHKGLRVALLHAPRAQLTERFTSLLIDPVFDAGADAPDLVIADYAFSTGAPDMEALDELAQHTASLPAVVLANVSPAFFGLKFAWQITTVPALIAMLDQWQFAKWKTLRGQPYARALGVVFGRCLLRTPHAGEAADALAYREECITDKDLLWAGGVIAAAAAVAQSVAKSGWPTAMAGMVHGRVEGFATTEGGAKGEKKFGPTDTQIPQPKIEELAAAGINAAVGVKDHDDAIVWNGFTAARPPKMDHASFLEVSLPYQLFATRLSALLLAVKPELTGLSAEQVTARVYQHICQCLGIEGEASQEQISVQTRPAEGAPGLQLAVTVTPPRHILPGGIPVVVGYRIV